MKESHDKIFIRDIWTVQGWAQRFFYSSAGLCILTASVYGWIFMLK